MSAAWNVYTATSWWELIDDPRCPPSSGKQVAPGHLIVLDQNTEAPGALAQGSISAVAPTLTGPQVTALAGAQGVANRAFVVQALALS